jgi:type IV pilus assembly protein PilW
MNGAFRLARGVTLVELMVAMSIGIIVIGAVVQLMVQSGYAHRHNDTLARLQERGEIALRHLARDITLAGQWGLVNRAGDIAGRATPAAPNPSALPVPTRCGDRFATDLEFPVAGDNNRVRWPCVTQAQPRSDSLLLRFAEPAPATPQTGRLQLHTDLSGGAIVADGRPPAGLTAPTAIHDLAAMGYYVARTATLFPTLPSLRRMTLTRIAGRPALIDQEIAGGIENLQVELIIDTDGDRRPDRIVHPDDAVLAARLTGGAPAARVLAVRVTLLIRSEDTFRRHRGAASRQLADVTLAGLNDGHMRLQMSRTVLVPNGAYAP